MRFSRHFRSRPSTRSRNACAVTEVQGGRRLCGREKPLWPALRKPAREGGDRCPVQLPRCPAPAPAARLRRSRGRSWTRRKWVSPFLGPGRTDPWAGARAEGWRRGSGTLPWGSVSAPRLRAAGWGPGAQGPRRDSGALAGKRGQTLSGPDRFLTGLARGERAARRGGREAAPAPEVPARGHTGASPVRHVPHVIHPHRHLGQGQYLAKRSDNVFNDRFPCESCKEHLPFLFPFSL